MRARCPSHLGWQNGAQDVSGAARRPPAHLLALARRGAQEPAAATTAVRVHRHSRLDQPARQDVRRLCDRLLQRHRREQGVVLGIGRGLRPPRAALLHVREGEAPIRWDLRAVAASGSAHRRWIRGARARACAPQPASLAATRRDMPRRVATRCGPVRSAAIIFDAPRSAASAAAMAKLPPLFHLVPLADFGDA